MDILGFMFPMNTPPKSNRMRWIKPFAKSTPMPSRSC